MSRLAVMAFLDRDGITAVRYSESSGSTSGARVFVAGGYSELSLAQREAFVGLVHRVPTSEVQVRGYVVFDGNEWARSERVRELG